MALLLTLVFLGLPNDAGAADAGTAPRFGAEVYGSCPVVPEGTAPAAEVADGGWLLPAPRGPRIACLLEACETDRALKEKRLESPATAMAAFSAGASLAITVAMGFVAVEKALKR